MSESEKTDIVQLAEFELTHHKSYDDAFKFVSEKGDESESLDTSRVLKKLDYKLMPILCAIYFLQFLDKSLLNYAAAMGIKKDLKGNEFANLSTIFYAAYIFGEPFVSYFLQTYPLSKTLGFFIFAWGVVVACHAACHTYASLMVVRTLLGVFESSSAISLITISGMFYSKPQQASRMGIWSIMSGVATIVGGLLSFAFQHVHSTKLASWQILFLFIGIITSAFGVVVCIFLPDSVTSAKFLDDDDKQVVLHMVRKNQTGTISKKFKKEHIYELLFRDKLTWPYFLLTLVSQIVTGSLGTFSVTITLSFGFDSFQSALLQLPVGALIIIIITIATQLVAKYGHISYIIASMFVPSIVGAIVLLATKLSSHKVGNLLGLYLLYSGSSSITLIYAWTSANTAGTSKKIFRSAMTMVAFSVGCIIGPQLFQSYSAPVYRPAKITILVTQIACIPLTFLIAYIAKKENQKRVSEPKEELPVNYEFLDLTDIQNRNFHYSY